MIISLLPYSFGFLKQYLFLKKSQTWSKEKLEQYQTQKLRELINHAYQNVPYYRRIFDERNLNPEDIKNASDLKKLPLLTKDIIRENFQDFIATNYSQDQREYVTTGGSSGIPLGFYYEKGVSRMTELAFMKTQWDRVGYHFFDKCVILRGNVVSTASEGKFWEKLLFGRWLVLSSYHMTDENLSQYVEAIRAFNPKFIQAYPSAITLLAKYMEKNKIPPYSGLKAILCGSENIYSWQRELIEKVFACRIYSWYGNSEQTVLAGECEVSAEYHIFPEYGIVELLDTNGNFIEKSHQPGEIVTTSLTNFVFPFIRYQTMDIGTYSDKKCSCGRNYHLFNSIHGRDQEFIITRTGRYISMVALNMHSDVFDNVRQFQFYQDTAGEVIMYIVKNTQYTEKDTEYIRNELFKKLGYDITLTISFVPEIKQNASGKCRFLVQKLPIGWKNYVES